MHCPSSLISRFYSLTCLLADKMEAIPGKDLLFLFTWGLRLKPAVLFGPLFFQIQLLDLHEEF